MKTTTRLFPVLLLLCLPPLMAAERICLGRLDPAGMPPVDLPREGESLVIESTEQPLRNASAQPAGYIPAVFRGQIHTMLQRGVRLRFDVVHRYHTPLPGRFISVEVWADTDDVTLLVPLMYKIELPEDIHLADHP